MARTNTTPRTTARQTREELDAQEIAAYTADANMHDTYGSEEWRRITEWLLEQGLSTVETILYLRSKYMRWADDACGRGDGMHAANLAAVREYEIRGTLNAHVDSLLTEIGIGK